MAPRGSAPLVLACLALANAAKDDDADCKASRCVMRGRRLAILGDSNSRYHSFNINRFLETCDVGPLDYDKWGEDGDWDDKNGNVYWTNNWGRSGSGSHLQGPMCMDFKEYKAKTCYWFLQSTWNSRMDPNFYTKLPGLVKTIQDDFDLVLFNSCWWDLKDWEKPKETRGYDDCGNKWDAGKEDKTCVKNYEADLKEVKAALFDPMHAAVFRSSSCCGDFKEARTETGKAVEMCNDVARAVIGDKQYVDVFENWSGKAGLKTNTVDNTHATPENYKKWTLAAMRSFDQQLGTKCFEDGPGPGPAPRPSKQPTRPTPEPTKISTIKPSAQPSKMPTKPPVTEEPTYEPTYKPTANPTPEPSRMPTPMPTYPKCEDDLSWAKKGEPRKTCNWVAALESRCVVKGDDDRWAFEACRESCDTCLRENLCSITGDSPTWIHASGQPFKNCQWVADFSGNRCAQPGQDGSYAFRSCPVACRTCGYGCGRDDPGWYKAGDAPDGRDCDWVGSATGVRCDTMGADGKLAFAACPAACRACAGAFGNCEDDKTWHKRGDVSKNCRWIDDTPSDSVKSQRCVVKGEDSDYAFLSCPVACDSC